MNSDYCTKEFFYRNIRSVNIALKYKDAISHMPFVSGGYSNGFKYLKNVGFEDYYYAYIPGLTERGKNNEVLFSAEGYLVPDEFIREFVENH